MLRFARGAREGLELKKTRLIPRSSHPPCAFRAARRLLRSKSLQALAQGSGVGTATKPLRHPKLGIGACFLMVEIDVAVTDERRFGSRYRYLANLTAWEVGLPLWAWWVLWTQGTAGVPWVKRVHKCGDKSLRLWLVWQSVDRGGRDGRVPSPTSCNFFGEPSTSTLPALC